MAASHAVTERIMRDLYGGWRTQALLTALDLGVFVAISQGHLSAGEISKALGLKSDGTERLLQALVGLGYLTADEQSYRLAPEVGSVLPLIQGSYFQGMAALVKGSWNDWGNLSTEIKGDTVQSSGGTGSLADEVYPLLAESLFYGHYGIARRLVERVEQISVRSIETIVDIGAGSAVWSIPFALKAAGRSVTAIDLPTVVPIARRFINQFGLNSQYEIVAADVRLMEFGNNEIDLALLGQVLHALPAEDSRALLKTLHAALRPGGMIVISETVSDDQKQSSSSLFRLYLYLKNLETDVFPMSVYREWLQNAGFVGDDIGEMKLSGAAFLFATKAQYPVPGSHS